MVTTDAATPTIPAWQWWESQRLRYGLILVGVGLGGFALIATAILLGRSVSVTATELLTMTVSMGLAYTLYMIVAHVLYLLGALVEDMFRPRPVSVYRRATWLTGTVAAAGLPLIAACMVTLRITLNANGIDGM